MVVLLLILAVAVTGWTLFIKTKESIKHENVAALSFIFAGLSTMGAIIMMATAFGRGSDLKSYAEVKWQISKISKIHVNDIPAINEAIRLNTDILEHRKHVDSVWVGIWYSKDVAKLEPIKLPE